MANAHLTAAEKPTTAVELPPEDAKWLAHQLDRFKDPSDTPAAAEAAARIREGSRTPTITRSR